VSAATPEIPGLTAVGPVVVLTGHAARVAAQGLLIAIRARRLSGYGIGHLDAIAAALVSASGHADGHISADADSVGVPDIPPTMPVEDAARALGLSKRQTRRLAPNLGGRLIGSRWLLDAQAVTEHIEGSRHG